MKGFTLIEIILSVGLIGIVSTAIVPSYSKLINSNGLESETSKIKENIRYARSIAKSGKYSDNYGVYFQASRYTLYSGSDYGTRDTSTEKIFEINDRLELSNYDEINFEMDTGLPDVTGTLKITNTANENSTTLEVNKLGLIK